MDSFMFRVSIAAGEFPMEEPQGQNRFFDRCAQYLLELSDELERNLYIEAIVKEYRRYGISVENLRKRVNSLAMKGTPAEKRIQPKSGDPAVRKKESAGEKSQKLMLTWLVTYPGIFETVEKYLTPSDFVVPLIKKWQRCSGISERKGCESSQTFECIYRQRRTKRSGVPV